MRSTSLSDFRRNLATWLTRVGEDHDALRITRRSKPAVVLMSLEDFASYEETRYLLSNPHNAESLLKAVRDLDNERGGRERRLAAR
jgi:antitoxin YefM